METRRLEQEDEELLRPLRRGWCLGSEDFRRQMLELAGGTLGANHEGELRRESAQARAERIVGEELGRLGWSERDLSERRKNDPAKLALAARLRKETTLTIQEIARRVGLGSSKSANGKLHHWMRNQNNPAPALSSIQQCIKNEQS